MRRSLLFALLATVLCFGMAPPAGAEDAPSMELRVSEEAVTVGDSFSAEVLVRLPQGKTLPGVTTLLTFDPAILELQGIEKTPDLGLSVLNEEDNRGKGNVKIAFGADNPDGVRPGDEFRLFTLTFKTLKDAKDAPIKLLAFEGRNPLHAVQDAKITVKGLPPKSYGVLSIVPPLVAVILAMLFKNVLASLFIGAYLGVVILMGGNPLAGLTTLIKDYIFVQASDSYNSSLLVMMVFIGGFVGVVTHSGGAAAFAEKASHWFNTRAKAQLAVWFGGIAIFFSDSANPLILGPTFQPITDKLRVSREKLAWLLDCTSSPVCILIPFIGWGIYIMGLIQKEFTALGIPETDFDAFLKVIPYQFYAIGTLFMIPLVALLGFEFSAMYKAEKRTVETGQPMWPDAKPARPSVSINLEEGVKPRASMMIIPIVVLFVCIFGLLIPHGFPVKRIPGAVLRTALCTGYFLGAMSCLFLMVQHKVKTAGQAFSMYMEGAKEIVFILMILVLAWSLGSVCKALGTANYIVGLSQGTLPGWAVPVLIFVTGACISFATGSSWGTFAILMPLAIPMANALGAPVHAAIGAVLSGGLFGDHCSPISDTTLLSSMGAACDHIDHVKTQLPYAMTVALASAIAYIVSGHVESPMLLGLALGLVLVFILVFGKIWGAKVSDFRSEEAR